MNDQPRTTVREGTIRVRVRYCECDPMGVAHHASYVPWLEMGRTELVREAGVSYATLEREGVFLVVAKMDVRYRRPARYDDVLELRTRWSGGSRVKVVHEYELRLFERTGTDTAALKNRGEDVLCIAGTTLACVNREGTPTPLPDWLVHAGGRG